MGLAVPFSGEIQKPLLPVTGGGATWMAVGIHDKEGCIREMSLPA